MITLYISWSVCELFSLFDIIVLACGTEDCDHQDGRARSHRLEGRAPNLHILDEEEGKTVKTYEPKILAANPKQRHEPSPCVQVRHGIKVTRP